MGIPGLDVRAVGQVGASCLVRGRCLGPAQRARVDTSLGSCSVTSPDRGPEQGLARHQLRQEGGMMQAFDEFFRMATGHTPHGYQARIARGGLPDVVQAPTGTGKTGIILAWLWRRLHESHGDRTPRRLVYALPQRSLVEQVAGEARRWLANLGLADRGRAARGDGRRGGVAAAVAAGHAQARDRDRHGGLPGEQGAEPGIRDRAGQLPGRLRAGHQRRALGDR